MEKDYEKIAKLIKLRRDYASRLRSVDDEIKSEEAGLSVEERDAKADEWFARRLDAGLYCLQVPATEPSLATLTREQMVDVILAWLVAEDDGAQAKIRSLMADRDESLALIRDTIQGQWQGGEDAVFKLTSQNK